MIAKLVTAVFQIIIGWFASEFAGLYADRIPAVASLFPYFAAAWIALTVWVVGMVIANVSGQIKSPGLAQMLASLIGALVFAALGSFPEIANLLPPEFNLQQLLPILGAVLGFLLVRG